MLGGGGGLGGEAGRPPALSARTGRPGLGANLGYLHALHARARVRFSSTSSVLVMGRAGPPPGPTMSPQAVEVGFLGGGRNFLGDNSFIIREVSLAENLGPVTESLSYGRGVATGGTGCV